MLGVLITVLGLDRVTVQRCLSRECKVALIVPVRVAGRAVLPVRGIDVGGRWPSPLWSLVPPIVIHSLHLP